MNDQRTDEELNRIIAEWCGARYFTEDGGAFYYFILNGIEYGPPTEDLNACHEAEKKWDEAGDKAYERRSDELFNIHTDRKHKQWHWISANARERAEALVRVIEKDGK